MDVFKTHVRELLAIPISDENFGQYTGLRPPFVSVHADNKRTFLAICPECDNPIQLVGLFRNQEDAAGRPYGRHVRHSVPNLARYDEDEYLACPYADPRYRKDDGRRPVNSPKGAMLRTLMRDRFDLIVADWERSAGIHMSVDYARRMLEGWKVNSGWLYYVANMHNLPWMLFFAAPAQPLVGRWIRKGSGLQRKLETLDRVRLDDVAPWYVQVSRVGNTYLDLSFLLWHRRIVIRDEHAEETFLLRILLDGKPVGRDLLVHADGRYLEGAHSRRGQRLLAVADEVLGHVRP